VGSRDTERRGGGQHYVSEVSTQVRYILKQ
jgi:hypothetical protein